MHKLNISISFFGLLNSFVFFLLAACQSNAKTASISMLKPGDQVAGRTLTTGAEKAQPIWAFCSPQNENHGITSDCHIPAFLSKVAIGHVRFHA